VTLTYLAKGFTIGSRDGWKTSMSGNSSPDWEMHGSSSDSTLDLSPNSTLDLSHPILCMSVRDRVSCVQVYHDMTDDTCGVDMS
jgi:hypothetical protein